MGNPLLDLKVHQQLRRVSAFQPTCTVKWNPTEVDRLPREIDGTCWYRIKCLEKEYTEKTSDLRWFLMRTSSRIGLVGRRKVGSCLGSYICSNKSCSYLSTEGKPNEKLFDYLYKKKVCRSCGVFAA